MYATTAVNNDSAGICEPGHMPAVILAMLCNHIFSSLLFHFAFGEFKMYVRRGRRNDVLSKQRNLSCKIKTVCE